MSEKHSPVGASGMHRWSRCPGSVRLIAETKPVLHETSYQAEGRLAHEEAARLLNASGFTRNKDVMFYIVYLRNNGLLNCEKIGVEYEFSRHDIHPDCFGTIDFWAFDRDESTLHVVDFKYGKGVPVSAKMNEQLMYYATMLLGCEVKEMVAKVVLHIVQPRADNYSKWEIATGDLINWKFETLLPAIEATKKKNAPLNVGIWCRFCPAKFTCPALEKVTEDIFSYYEVPMSTLPTSKLLEIFNYRTPLRSLLAQAEAELISRIEAGEKIPGYKVAKTKTGARLKPEAEKLPENESGSAFTAEEVPDDK